MLEQRLAVAHERRDHWNFTCGELEREGVLLGDLVVAPATRSVELGDDARAVVQTDLIDAVLIAVQREQPSINRPARLLERVEHAVGRERRSRGAPLGHRPILRCARAACARLAPRMPELDEHAAIPSSRSTICTSAMATCRSSTGCRSSVPRGKVVAILGASGCGKSTLLKLIGGQLRPARGRIGGARRERARPRRGRTLRATPRHGHDVPGERPVQRSVGLREHRVSDPRALRPARGTDSPARADEVARGGPAQRARHDAGRSVGWHDAARGARARDRAPTRAW